MPRERVKDVPKLRDEPDSSAEGRSRSEYVDHSTNRRMLEGVPASPLSTLDATCAGA